MSARDVVRAVPDIPKDDPADEAALFAAPPKRGPRTSGRVRHDEKITVYLSMDELHELDLARLQLNREHGVKVDRGRVVREAVAMLLADLADRGPDSQLVRRLRR